MQSKFRSLPYPVETSHPFACGYDHHHRSGSNLLSLAIVPRRHRQVDKLCMRQERQLIIRRLLQEIMVYKIYQLFTGVNYNISTRWTDR